MCGGYAYEGSICGVYVLIGILYELYLYVCYTCSYVVFGSVYVSMARCMCSI